ncbi:MAG TPA: ATP-binding protein [Bacteroidales bacterium]|nr:ATP-binding protein [Bacteroidales bacterium]HRW84960.1 ATP-binding protein [Bacteroidales bacterium]
MKIYWIASVAVTLMIAMLTLTYHLIFPQLRIIIYYGLILTVIFSQGVIYPIIFPRRYWKINTTFMLIDQSLVSIITFICILKLGGIPYSGGLAIVGLAMVFFSLNLKKKAHSLAIFFVYIFTIILAGVLHPYLTVPPEMTEAVNISLFVVNLLWISGFALVFVLSFISLRVRVEQMEADHLKELEQAKTRLFTNMTHEFRTPLTIISGMTDLIRNDPEKWLEDGCEKIDRNSDILLNLVNRMLDLAKLESGSMPLKMSRSDIDAEIHNIVELLRSAAERKKITLTFSAGATDPVIDHDPEKTDQIVTNLLSNAIKFTQENGIVKVSTQISSGNEYEIRVSDNGPGIPGNKIPNIFDRFYRADDTIQGSGLGLALTRELVRLLNGTITVKSIIGKGTEFTVQIPVTRNEPLKTIKDTSDIRNMKGKMIAPVSTKTRFPADQSSSGTRKPLLLIVEDNTDVVAFLLSFLEKEYQIIIALNGKEGLDKAVGVVPDIIISDIMMPVMDGIEMLDRIKNDLRTSHIPLILLTARADQKSRIEGLKRGADAYVAKPFNREELLIQTKNLLNTSRRLQERYSSTAGFPESDNQDLIYEDLFMQNIRKIMLDHISDESFDTRKLCREMTMSRTQLYRKFRSLTNTGVGEYFRSVRLHEAKTLILNSKLTISEIAYKTGFRNVSHFSRTFAKEFGASPSSLRTQESA